MSVSISTPSLPHLHSSSMSSKSSASNQLNLRLQAEDLRKLPADEALRQVLIDRCGSLKNAYRFMDIHHTGEVNEEDFERAMQGMGFFESPLIDFATTHDLFWKLISTSPQAKGANPTLSIHELLGYVPVDKSLGQTRTKWFEYHNRSSSVPSTLARVPCWRSSATNEAAAGTTASRAPRSLEQEPGGILEQRRRLQKQMHKVRTGGTAAMRLLVGPASEPMKKCEGILFMEKAQRSKRRIEGAIRDCSRKRHELVEVQKLLASVTKKDPTEDPDSPMYHLCAMRRKSSLRAKPIIDEADAIPNPT